KTILSGYSSSDVCSSDLGFRCKAARVRCSNRFWILKSTRRGGCPHPPGRAKLGGIWRFCPDEGVRAYVGRNRTWITKSSYWPLVLGFKAIGLEQLKTNG